jgi:hypothetical protein
MHLVIHRHRDGTVTVSHDGPETVVLHIRQHGTEEVNRVVPDVLTYLPIRLAATAADHPAGTVPSIAVDRMREGKA